MRPKKRATHAVYDLKVHLAWITKYRYKVLTKDMGIKSTDIGSTELRC